MKSLNPQQGDEPRTTHGLTPDAVTPTGTRAVLARIHGEHLAGQLRAEAMRGGTHSAYAHVPLQPQRASRSAYRSTVTIACGNVPRSPNVVIHHSVRLVRASASIRLRRPFFAVHEFDLASFHDGLTGPRNSRPHKDG